MICKIWSNCINKIIIHLDTNCAANVQWWVSIFKRLATASDPIQTIFMINWDLRSQTQAPQFSAKCLLIWWHFELIISMLTPWKRPERKQTTTHELKGAHTSIFEHQIIPHWSAVGWHWEFRQFLSTIAFKMASKLRRMGFKATPL